jgi:hypothetical protein
MPGNDATDSHIFALMALIFSIGSTETGILTCSQVAGLPSTSSPSAGFVACFSL